MNQLHDELALESVTNIEFEQSSRRSFEFLTGQVRTLKEAFNTLTDTLLEELDHLATGFRGELWRLDERQSAFEKGFLRDTNDQQLRQQEKQQQMQQDMQRHLQELQRQSERQTERQAELEKRVELMAQDLDTVLAVVPKIEDTMLKSQAHLQERIGASLMDISKLNDVQAADRVKVSSISERLESRLRSLEGDMREELEQRHLKLQRSITRQLESMSRVLVENDRPGMGMNLGAGDASLLGGHGFGRQVDFDLSGMGTTNPGLGGASLGGLFGRQ